MKRRNTPSKEEIFELLKASKRALSHEMIQEALTINVDRATIYRNLNSFCEDGSVHKIVADDGKQYFAFCKTCETNEHHHNHFHFRCLDCGKVECLNSEISVKLPQGYSFNQLNAIITGTCNLC